MPIPTVDRLLEVAKFTLEVKPDTVPYVGNCSAVDPQTDRAAEERIRAELRDGNVWAWCVVTVTASWGGVDGADDTLCGCSYGSEEDFKLNGMYDDMRRNAAEFLHEALMARRAEDIRESRTWSRSK